MGRALSFVIFPIVSTAVNAGIHYYLWARLIRDTRVPAPWSRVATAVLVLLALLVPTALILGRWLWPDMGRMIAWPAFAWMGLMFMLFVGLVATDAVRALVLLFARLGGKPDMLDDPERRLVLSRGVAMATGAVATTFAAVGAQRVSEGAAVKTVEVVLDKLPRELDGFTLAQLTDVHVGPTIGRDYVQHLVELTNSFKPDAVAITGDLVDGTPEELGHAVRELAGIKSRHGTFFVTGNHEYYSGADEWLAELQRMGMRLLRNQRVEIVENGAVLDLAGVDDFSARRFGEGHGPDLEAALAGRNAANPLVLMAHQPREIFNAAQAGVGLQISGHTHGGQIWPWNYMVLLQQPYVEGLFRHGANTQLYVSPGTGYWGPPMRVGTRSEVTRLILRSPDKVA